MKKIVVMICLALTSTSWAQEKQPVYSIVEERHELEWYQQQWKLWKDDALNGSKEVVAWYNYYTASRALRNLEEGEKKAEYLELCHTIREEMLKKFPKSFEANYVAAIDHGLADRKEEYLFKAHAISPNDQRLFDELLIHYEIEQEEGERAAIAQKMVVGNDIAPGILNWGHNLLSELDMNSIVFSAGDNDTYGLWLNQFGMDFRKDVTVMNIYMILLPDYRQKLFDKLGIAPINSEAATMEEVVLHILKNTKNHPLYFASTTIQCFELETINENTYLTGLAYKYCETPIDNLSLIRRNVEQRYALDYLTLKFSTHRMDGIAENFNQFYIAPLVKLYKMYSDSNEQAKKERTGELLLHISKGGVMEAEVRKIMAE